MVLTPEKTVISYSLASVGPRMGAQIIDLLLILALELGVALAGEYLLTVFGDGIIGIAAVLFVGIPFAYFILFEGLWNGCTPGKKASKLRVKMVDGTPITFSASLGRNLFRAADFLPSFYFVGLVSMFTTSKSQRLGDLIANTIVVHEGTAVRFSYVSAPHHVGIHSYESSVGELSGMTLEEYKALRRFCDRFPELPTVIQEKMIREVWEPIAEKRKIQPVYGLHPLYLAEAAVMKYGRSHGLL